MVETLAHAIGPDVNSNNHILVVDDDPGIREVIGDFLSDHGYDVARAADGKAMRAAMSARPVDLIVLDMMMPGEDGLSILRSLDPATMPAVIM
ncbi:MAG: response regulator transcription factor, partial [Sphingobium sp.]